MTTIRRTEFTDELGELLGRDPDLHGSDPVPWPAHELWAAFDGDTPVALAAGRSERADPTTYFLSTCFVRPESRGAGIQKRLIRARIRFARKQSYLRCWTYTATFSIASMRSLIACGFRPTSARRVPGFVCWELRLC